MTIAYNQHTFTSVSIGPTGHQHDRAADAEDEAPTEIDCDECAPFLAADGWVFSPELVPPTDRQIALKERRAQEGQAAVTAAAAALAVGISQAASQTKADEERKAEKQQKAEAKAAKDAAKAEKNAAKEAAKVEPEPTQPEATEPEADAPEAIAEKSEDSKSDGADGK